MLRHNENKKIIFLIKLYHGGVCGLDFEYDEYFNPKKKRHFLKKYSNAGIKK